MFEMRFFRIACSGECKEENIFNALCIRTVSSVTIPRHEPYKPVVHEDRVEWRFLESLPVHCLNAIVHAVDANFIWRQSDDLAVLLMRAENRVILTNPIPCPQDPQGRIWSQWMSIRDLRQWRKEARIDNEMVQEKGHQRDACTRRHAGQNTGFHGYDCAHSCRM